jgi:DNA-binding SARP family transcriptional activator
LEFQILGSMEVLDGTRRVDLPAGRGRALLALLVLHAGETVSAERLIDELWGEHPPATAPTVVQGLVSRLRKELEPDRGKGQPPTVLETVGPGYRLAIERAAVDADRFKRSLDEARTAIPEVRSQMLADALSLWHGPALADFTYEPFAQRAITALEELRLSAIEDRAETDLSLGRAAALVGDLEQLIKEHPFRERLRGLLMIALYRSGRQADALEAYRDARDALVDELGIEPGPALQDLEQAILRHDPALELGWTRGTEPSSVQEWLPAERRPVTVVALDLSPLADRHADPEAQGRLGARATDLAKDVLGRHGARVETVLGDMLVAFFGFPVAHEDDAVRAARAAVELRAGIGALDADPKPGGGRHAVRIGIETGDIVVGGAGASLRDIAAGPAVTAARRLQQGANDGDVIVGPATARLIRGTVVLKPADDIAREGDAPAAWRVLDVVAGAPPVERALDAPMFGRQQELTRLRTAFRATARAGAPSSMLILGEAGIGKTRLARELLASIGEDARVITGRCAAYGEGITFLPLREAILDAAGPRGWPALAALLSGTDDGPQLANEIASAIGLNPSSGNVQAVPAAVARLFEALAADRPLLVVLEDLHWAEATFLDLVESLTRHGRGAVFILGIARPDLIERRPGWSSADAVGLEPLSPEEITDLIDDRAGTLAPDTRRRIVDAARGNPLFAEQLLAALDDPSMNAIPISLQSLLRMRLDRLGPGERDLLRCASVIGTEWDRDALSALLPDDAHPFIDRHLDTLARKRLIASTEGQELRFVHVLIQLAAYQSMTREDRARLHERFADWLAGAASETPPELDEIVGYHLEQAVEQRRAAGLSEDDVSLSVRAGERLADAAAKAFARLDLTAADNLMSRARTLLPLGHERRPGLTQTLAEVNLILGRFPRAQGMLREKAADAAAAGDQSSERAALLEHARIQFIIGPDPVPLSAIRREADEAAAFYAETADEAGRGRAAFLLGCVDMREGSMTAAAADFRESLFRSDRTMDLRERLASRWMLSEVLLLGPTPVARCLEEYDMLVASLEMEHPGILTHRAVLEAMRGHFDEARALNDRARFVIVEVMRAPRMLMFVAESQAAVEQLSGDLAAAERELCTRLGFARENGEPYYIAQSAARLSLVLRSSGRSDEATEFARVSAETAPAEGAAEQALSRVAMAGMRADAGDRDDAARLAREAIEIAPREMLNVRADVLMEAAGILAGSGDARHTSQAVAEAVGLYKLKGNVVAAERSSAR